MSTIYEAVSKEYERKGLVDIPFLKERLCASVGAHIVNQNNIDVWVADPKQAMYEAGDLENFRLHIAIMAPAGFGKSFSFKMMLNPTGGILSKVPDLDLGLRSTFTPESWIGTAMSKKGVVTVKQGLFNRFKRGIVGADEFMRFIGMMDTSKIEEYSNEEVYLLQALDSHRITKDMSYATVEEEGIGTTMWIGSRIAHMDMKHGLARRVLFQIFMPTPSVCKEFRKALKNDELRKPISEEAKEDVANAVIELRDRLSNIHEFDYTAFNSYIDQFEDLPHFEVILLRRIAIGMSAARGLLPEIRMDGATIELIKDEMRNRKMIRGFPEAHIVREAVHEEGEMSSKKLNTFLSNYYQFTEDHTRSIIRAAIGRGYIFSRRVGNNRIYYTRD